MIYRYSEWSNFAVQLSRIVREEMRHFEQVLQLIQQLQFEHKLISSSRYAKGLHQYAKEHNPSKVDDLVIASIIEARSYERFELLQDALEGRIADLYSKLKESEYRHFLTYLDLAKQIERESEIDKRVQVLLECEAKLITGYDSQFRFHSGDPDRGASRRQLLESTKL